MKVTVFSDIKAEQFFSMNIYAEQLVEALRESGLEVNEFSVTLPKFPARLHNLSRFVGRYIKYPWQMQRARGQLNHISDHSYGFLTYFLPCQSCVVTCHDLAPLLAPAKGWRTRLKKELWKVALRGTLRASMIIADSHHTKQDILKHTGYPPQRVVVIHPGLDPLFGPRPNRPSWENDFRARYGLGATRLILHVGQASPRKNFEGVLQTFATLHTRLKGEIELKLLQIGGTFNSRQQQLIAALGISDLVVQIPFLARAELPYAYNLASAFVFPSYYEGFGWPPLEAMACGVPVVASRAASLPEVVGEAALLFEPDDWMGMAGALSRLLTEPTLHAAMVDKGLQRAALFNWQEYAQQAQAVYQAVHQKSTCDN